MKGLSLFFSVFFLTMQVSLGQPIALAQPMMVEDTASAKIVRDFVIVSPKPGTWVNKQPLVLEVPESCEVFYSFSGSHPMESGFAYDGPVMLEAEARIHRTVGGSDCSSRWRLWARTASICACTSAFGI